MSRAQNWLIKNVGLENFKGGLERSATLIGANAQKIQEKSKIVTIAGTNGKGQVACQLSELLEREGLKVARWTSPHLVHVSERFYFSSEVLSDEDLLQVFQTHSSIVTEGLSYYEFLFYIFCQLCAQQEPDVVILEVGLGGRLDAVNIFDADYTAITSIALDHQEILGSELAGILQEKWGVSRRGSPMLSVLHQKELLNKASELAAQQEVPWLDLIKAGLVSMQQGYWQRNLNLARALSWVILGTSLSGLRLRASELMAALPRELKSTKGRFEEMTSGGVRFIFVGAHNCDGLQNLVAEIEQRWSHRKNLFDEIWLSFSQRPANEIESFFKALSSLNSQTRGWRYCSFDHPKALQRVNIDETKWRLWSQVLSPPIQETSLQRALREKAEAATILVTGSYYFVGEVQKHLL